MLETPRARAAGSITEHLPAQQPALLHAVPRRLPVWANCLVVDCQVARVDLTFELGKVRSPQVDLDTLREATWSGCPPPLRADCWRLLLGYLPPSRDRRRVFVVLHHSSLCSLHG